MSSNSAGRVDFVDVVICYQDDHGIEHIFNYGQHDGLQDRLNKYIKCHPDHVIVKGRRLHGDAIVELRLVGPVQVDDDITLVAKPNDNNPLAKYRIQESGWRVSGVVIYGSARDDINMSMPVWFNLWPHLNRGCYVNKSGFAHLDQNNVMVRPTPAQA